MDQETITTNIYTLIELPNEVLIKILEFVPKRDHHIVGLVSKRFQEIMDSVYFEEPSILNITEQNIQEIKSDLKNKNCKLSFKRVEIRNIRSKEDLKFILQSIGLQINHLSIKNADVFEILECNVINVKSLELYFYNGSIVNTINIDLRVFPFLEKLYLKFEGNCPHALNLLEQLKDPRITFSLKHFKFIYANENYVLFYKDKSIIDFPEIITESTETYLIDTLWHHKITLTSLDVFGSNYSYNTNWEYLWSSLKNLKSLRLAGNLNDEIVSNCLSILSEENQLEKIDLWQMNDMLMTVIVEKWMDSLQHLELSYCEDLTNDGIMKLSKLTKLRVLKLVNSNNIYKMNIALENHFFMEELFLENFPNLDEFGLHFMVSSFHNLRVLKINNLGEAITNTFMTSIFRFLTRLRVLSIDNCFNITEEPMIGFGRNTFSIQRLRLLEELTLNHCRNLTDHTLIEALHLPKLRCLELGNYHKLTSKGIESLVTYCPSIEILGLPSITMIDDKVLFIIGNGLKRLCQLNISDCIILPENVRDHIRDVFDALKDPITNNTFAFNCVLNMDL